MKRNYLHIGEIAQLLDITPKAIRHYQKVGLLREPERSESGYRLYGAQELLRLQRIRRLQALGLSLKQVKSVLGDVSQEQTLRNVLLALDEELASQIQVLEQRRERVRTLLAMETLASVTETTTESASFQAVRAYIEQHDIAVSSALMEQEARVYAHLEDFHWAEGYEQMVQELAAQLLQYASEHPEEHRQLLALGERLVTIASLPADAPEVELLVQDFRAYFRANTFLFDIGKRFPAIPNPFNAVFSELVMSVYSPAQQRIFEEIQHIAEENNQ